MNIKKITSVRRKSIAVPITNQEKFNKLKSKNPNIENLKDAFDLNIDL